MATFIRFVSSLIILQLGFSAVSEAASFGHHHSLNHANLHKRALAVSTTLPGQWTSKGCYTDNTNSRVLQGKGYNDAAMTEESCINFCATNNFAYAGVEYSQECYCANIISVSGSPTPATDCNMACGGDAGEACGGPNRLNIFHNDAITTQAAAPATNAGVNGWGFMGCYIDSQASRTLPIFYSQPLGGGQNMSTLNCVNACGVLGATIAGTEYSGECYCGNQIPDAALAPDGLTGCNMLCNGNSSEFCGGSNRLDVFGLGVKSTIAPAWAPVGCYTDSVQLRTLTVGTDVRGGAPNMTQENCQDACHAKKYALAGVEYSGECYCDNTYHNGGGPAPDGNAGCNMACNGNPAEVCGGANRLNVFSYVGSGSSTTTTATSATLTTAVSTTPVSTTPVSTTPVSTTPVSTTPVSTTPSATPTSTGSSSSLIKGWTYRGCYNDGPNGRILSNQQPDDQKTLTIESCVAACNSSGYHIAGLEYTYQCFCGNAIQNGGNLASADSNCAMTCSGNSSEVCGGPNLMSIYAIGNFSSYAVPTPQTTDLPGNWAYQGCLTDTVNRVLPYEIDMNTNLTVPNCLNLCYQYGYSAAGVEYGTQCFCGDDTDRVNSGAAYRTDGACSYACSGDPQSICGGGLALNYYTAPVKDNWAQGVGNSAGAYKFLIGGLTIPLTTSANRNGKVTFLEKHGTGAGNSTGAYELDLSAIDDSSIAWRELQGLKTDVFCSAGLTLPDKAGRVLNIGGWSTDSLFGVRLFTPDGSPGVPGKSGWQEDVTQAALQIGRWYPSAMMMANGSILVVGGEDGSNGPPVPNLEILPKPAGGYLVHCDWLQRTDPYNLYPFLSLLPTGGIMVIYYNEARILDEVTLQTVRTLPNIPGSVNNFLSGRTYPLEGTTMILPQSAPYTDPLTYLICGGSSPYGGHALDNCVTISPEVPGANWTIERMPSKRVIPSMVALPDGTFLIMNGAQSGVAGFGLADNPNLNAVLYDPSKPLHNRMTRLANTTVARMYHNEAILLQDGRVLISGSDPENLDGKYPQEYRVEVFIPPYLMALNEPLAINVSQQVNYFGNNASATVSNATFSNATYSNSSSNSVTCGARPVFNLAVNNTDWAYGGTYKFTMLCGSVGKVSLMGSVVSTHGNSMGQRTLFPAFSCSGSACIVTAPPNTHIAGGAGWFMMFVMGSNGVPSIAEWIRIGGDPAKLGNWPNTSSFVIPGV